GVGGLFAAAFGLDALQHSVEGLFEDFIVIIVACINGAADSSQFFLPGLPGIAFRSGSRDRRVKAAGGLHTGVFPDMGCRQKWQI
ncbi:MAG: hypothetical protein RL215_2871, partial [Planctomycetota bacterium]